MKRAIFLDRDGTIIKNKGYICKFSEVEIFPFSIEAVKAINNRGYLAIVVTNQSSVARGICTEEQIGIIHDRMKRYFQKYQANIEKFYYCPYHRNGVIDRYRKDADCRKPSPGMILHAAKEFNIDLSKSFMIGDSTIDIEAGHRAGCKTVLVRTGGGKEAELDLINRKIKPDYITENILSAVFICL